ncbi:MAG TPA: hypothetical protein VF841_20065 [Anaeromyxobacter sp.]
MASTAKVLSSSFPATRYEPAVRAAAAHAPRARPGWLELLRDTAGFALVIAATIALWTLTWAAVAGPLSPASGEGTRGQVVSVESSR